MAGDYFAAVSGYFVTAAFTVFNMAIYFLLPLAGAIVLQIYLSKQENRWLGLILPCLFSVPSIVSVLIVLLRSIPGSVGVAIGFAFLLFLLCNIPTTILLIIYFTIRAPRKNKKEIDKMNIQDLS
jgi:hypothetical protein